MIIKPGQLYQYRNNDMSIVLGIQDDGSISIYDFNDDEFNSAWGQDAFGTDRELYPWFLMSDTV